MLNSSFSRLHIGNIAGNAYQAVQYERSKGFESFVLNPDLKHVMSHPIWEIENIDFETDLNDIDYLKNRFPQFRDPEFYIDGSLFECLEKLAIALNCSTYVELSLSNKFTLKWRKLGARVMLLFRKIRQSKLMSFVSKFVSAIKLVPKFFGKMIMFFFLSLYKIPLILIGSHKKGFGQTFALKWRKLGARVMLLFRRIRQSKLMSFVSKFVSAIKLVPKFFGKMMMFFFLSLYKIPLILIGSNKKGFPKTQLPEQDLAQLQFLVPSLKILKIVAPYFDEIVLYGPWAALASFDIGVKFKSVEHGTIRSYIFESHPWARATRNGFKNSERVLITNADCLPVAINENFSKVIPSVHPFNIGSTDRHFENRIRLLTNNFQPTHVLLASRIQFETSRDAKGSNIALEAIEEIHNLKPNLCFTFFAYGENLQLAREHIKSRKMSEYVKISHPLSRNPLLSLFSQSLCVLDGFSLAGIGRIQIESWCVGVPVLSKHDEKLNLNFFTETVPTFNVSSLDGIVSKVLELENLSSMDLVEIAQKSRKWAKDHHDISRFDLDLNR